MIIDLFFLVKGIIGPKFIMETRKKKKKERVREDEKRRL